MPRIFLSYRRADSRAYTERIHDRLVTAFGDDNVFLDVATGHIPPGQDFRQVLQAAIQSADIVLVIIGPKWLDIRENDYASQRRLDNPNDFVRIEVEAALNEADKLVIPVLVNHAEMPSQEVLPDALLKLVYLQAISIRGNPDFNSDVKRLIAAVAQATGEPPRPPSDEAPAKTEIRLMGQFGPSCSVTLSVAVGVFVFILFGGLVAVLLNQAPQQSASTAAMPTNAAVALLPAQTATQRAVDQLLTMIADALTDTSTPTGTASITSPPTADFQLTEAALQIQTLDAANAFLTEIATEVMTSQAQLNPTDTVQATATLFVPPPPPPNASATPTLLSINDVQLTATALAAAFAPTQEGIPLTVEGGVGGGEIMPTRITQNLSETGGGGLEALPDTGLLDDILGGNPAKIILLVLGLLCLIVGVRYLRKRNRSDG